MLGLSNFGMFHTAISLVAVAAGIVAFFRYGAISSKVTSGRIYLWMTVLSCVTGFFIFRFGTVSPAHILGVLTLMTLAIAFKAERGAFSNWAPYVATVGYSLTFFFHMVPAFTETTTRIPQGSPLTKGPEDPLLQAMIGTCFLIFLVGAYFQMRRIRRSTPISTAEVLAASSKR